MLCKFSVIPFVVLVSAAPALAANITTIEAAGPVPAATLDSGVIVDYIASQPATLDGFTYSSYAILAHDATGSVEIFGKLPTGAAAPNVGDAITASGQYALFNGIPELENLTAISTTTTGNPTLAPKIVTIPDLLALTSTPNYNISEYLLELDNVTLTGATSFAAHANTTLTVADSASNSVTAFQWASSYMAAGALGGNAIPAGPVNITGIVDVFNGTTPEFVPFSVTAAAPEPASLSALALGAAALVARRRR